MPATGFHSAIVLHGPKDLRVERRQRRPPSDGQVQVSIQATGLCGSDLHYYIHGKNGDFAVKSPLVLGHEAAGIITHIGPNVPPHLNLRVGDRVAIEPGAPCGRCEFCEMGRYNLCERMRFCSSAKSFPHLDGTLQTCMNHPARLLHKLPDSCSFEQAALAEPLSVVLHAARRIGLRVLIIGAGAVGFLAAALVRTLSALGESTAPVSFIAAMDLDKGKLDTLMDAGYADAIYHVTSPVVSQRAGGKVGGMTREEGLLRSRKLAKEALAALSVDDRGAIKGYDVVFECTGVESCIQTAILMARTGGKVALVGMGYPNPYLPLSSAMLREVDLVGVFRYANTWPDALRLLASKTMLGIEDVMVTQRFALEETGQAFKILAGGSGSGRGTGETVIKIMVGPNYGSGMKGRVGVVASP
ncbi:chaperonin 10-like protein [Cantharellus anzutake]|uniref:chaperonin 10-like protein n=1 Tax=Cantharellus anzutake TaxID=1750568 RepID=UPI001903455D|nr:chaperonin 10-like protein [Cantharellus anzutake]KAF8331288.1 chaperonin 10-like protein [Cantharellus anzutake]